MLFTWWWTRIKLNNKCAILLKAKHRNIFQKFIVVGASISDPREIKFLNSILFVLLRFQSWFDNALWCNIPDKECRVSKESGCHHNFETADLVTLTCSLKNYVTFRSYIKETFKRLIISLLLDYQYKFDGNLTRMNTDLSELRQDLSYLK